MSVEVSPWAGMPMIASSDRVDDPEVDALYVSQPTDRPPTHRVKLATTVKRHGVTFYVWECVCGSSSALCTSQGSANASYREHKLA